MTPPGKLKFSRTPSRSSLHVVHCHSYILNTRQVVPILTDFFFFTFCTILVQILCASLHFNTIRRKKLEEEWVLKILCQCDNIELVCLKISLTNDTYDVRTFIKKNCIYIHMYFVQNIILWEFPDFCREKFPNQQTDLAHCV